MKRREYIVTIDFENDNEGAAAADSLADAVAVLGVEFMVRATVVYDKTVDVPGETNATTGKLGVSTPTPPHREEKP